MLTVGKYTDWLFVGSKTEQILTCREKMKTDWIVQCRLKRISSSQCPLLPHLSVYLAASLRSWTCPARRSDWPAWCPWSRWWWARGPPQPRTPTRRSAPSPPPSCPGSGWWRGSRLGFVCLEEQRKWISRTGTDLVVRPFPSCWKFFQFFNEKQNRPDRYLVSALPVWQKFTLHFPRQFFQNILIMNCISITVVNGEGGLGRDRVTVSILRHALHLALVSLLPDWFYPEEGAALEVWYEISGVRVAQLLPVLLPGEAGCRLASGVAVEGSDPTSLDFLRGGRTVDVWRI